MPTKKRKQKRRPSVSDGVPERFKRVLLRLRHPEEVQGGDVTWLIQDILPVKTLAVLSGRDKLGKTLLAWEMVRAVLTGSKLFETFAVERGPVVFVALDDPLFLTGNRLDQLGLRQEKNLRVVTPLDVETKDPDSFVKAFFSGLMKMVKPLRPILVVIDALYQFLPAGEEAMNDAAKMAPLLGQLNGFAGQTGAAVLVITHDRKSGGDVAGSFVIRAGGKQILRLSHPSKRGMRARGGNTRNTKRRLEVESKLSSPHSFLLDFRGPGQWRLQGGAARVQKEDIIEVVKAWLQQGRRGTVREIAEAVSRRTQDVSTALHTLEQQGFAERKEEKSGNRGKPRSEWRFRNLVPKKSSRK